MGGSPGSFKRGREAISDGAFGPHQGMIARSEQQTDGPADRAGSAGPENCLERFLIWMDSGGVGAELEADSKMKACHGMAGVCLAEPEHLPEYEARSAADGMIMSRTASFRRSNSSSWDPAAARSGRVEAHNDVCLLLLRSRCDRVQRRSGRVREKRVGMPQQKKPSATGVADATWSNYTKSLLLHSSVKVRSAASEGSGRKKKGGPATWRELGSARSPLHPLHRIHRSTGICRRTRWRPR